MANTVTVVPNKDFMKKKETYEFHWTIPNWREVCEDPDLVNSEKIILEADPSSRFQTKWAIGLKTVPHYPHSYLLSEKGTQVYWQLLEVKGAEQKLTASIHLQLLTPDTGVPRFAKKITQHVKLGDIIEIPSYLLVKPYLLSANSSLIHSNGSVKYALKLSLKSFESHQIERFSRKSNKIMCKNLAALLSSDDGDLKIISSDGATLSAHKCILKVQCPVFAAMFNFENSESSIGLVKVDDLSEKTMKILLHYFYTSELLPTWTDEDTIVEFTYAAGKYQVAYVLELLDDLLGVKVDVEINYHHVQLLSLAGKLCLKNAETRLLQQIKDRVKGVETSDELFELFGLEKCKSEKGSLNQDGDKFEKSSILKIVDYALGNLEYQELFNNRGLQVLALVQKDGLKNVEKILLKRFAETVSKVQNADELFAIFGHGK